MFSILDLIGRSLSPIRIVDVGAMWLGAEDVQYRTLVKGGVCEVVGFEPVQAECDKLNAMKIPRQRYLPYFIGDGSQRTFHLTAQSMCSSLYEPNHELLAMFTELPEYFGVQERSTVQTRRLDDIPEVESIDYLKADVQGGELDVFRGATRLLAGTLVIESEVEFIRMYKDQPLFGDVDRFLREQGFEFHTFTGVAGRMFRPAAPSRPDAMPRQIIWSNAIYVRDFRSLHALPAAQLLKLAAILHEVYRSFDLAHLALDHADRQTGAGIAPVYRKRVLAAGPSSGGIAFPK